MAHAVTLALVLVLGGAAILMFWYVRKRNRSYPKLLADYNRLDHIVTEWRYPDGGLVPQEKRMKLMYQCRRAWRRVRNHPDHPLKN